MKTLTSRIFIISSLLFLLTNCQTIDIRGQYVDDNAVAALENKKLTKDEIVDLIGTPTIVPDYTKDTWYYVQRSIARRAWVEPKVVEQRIVKIKFNKNDQIEEVLVIKNEHAEDIQVISEYTKTYGTELNGVQKFIGNIGRFNKTTDGKKRGRK